MLTHCYSYIFLTGLTLLNYVGLSVAFSLPDLNQFQRLNIQNNIENLATFYKKLNDFKQIIAHNEGINYLEQKQIIYKINSILNKFKNLDRTKPIVQKQADLSISKNQNFNDITFIFYYMRLDLDECIKNLIDILPNESLNTQIIIAINAKYDLTFDKLNKNYIKILKLDESSKWSIMNYLLSLANTEFIFLAEDLNPTINIFNNVAQLKHLITKSKSHALVSAQIRGSKPKKPIPTCFKSEMKYYALKYTQIESDSASIEGCLKCDYVDLGVFLARTDLLAYALSNADKNSNNLLYIHIFLELKKENFFVFNCNQIFFNINAKKSTEGGIFNKNELSLAEAEFKSLMRKHELELVRVRDSFRRVLFTFQINDCNEVSLACFKGSQSKDFALPRCCRDLLAKGLTEFDERLGDNYIRAELDSGSLIGALKFSHILPWDIDGDVTFPNRYRYEVKEILKQIKRDVGFGYGRVEIGDGETYFQMYPGPFFIEIFGLDRLNSFSLNGSAMTKVYMNKKWVGSKNSPGLYCRNRYGRNVFKHAISWRYSGLENSFGDYSSRAIRNACAKMGHHSCMASLGSDGNLQYIDFD